ncbi:hypothetical protein H3T61_05900 [Gilliamella sp. B14384H2]|uniref:hypothetical protein n=1 Tax=unclassified Gilliamella TaxID=2685620 RepID=UPI0018DE9C7A|nr:MULTISPECIES: hypothetical protein [unclassified Gilliamella]MBI0037756.1 hypothetical protein [Gilliamella sp. B14384G10]MBI0039751.1 hypothetical protein [Gilliamella sp. B14384G7]MBI0051591.1 hypothetical protein [Gilliamella sp. B14384G13]MBI0054043.1 hypothetical protein [Gilliamella sp. B14384H2]
MDKLKQIYKLSPIALLIIVIFSIYFAYQCFEDEQTAKQQMTELSSQMQQLQQKIIKNNQIITDNELSKHELENQSISRQEQINEQLKDDDCANRLIPMPISGSMYNRAKSLRESANPSKSTQ